MGVAKNPRRKRKFRRYLKGQADEVLNLGTLAASTLVGALFDESVVDRTFVSSLRATHSLDNFTPTITRGPILVGVAHGDYTDAEIEEWIENTGSWNEGNLVQQEVAKRRIRRIGIFDTPDAAVDSVVLNDGRPITTKLGWILLEAQTLRQWAYNLGTGALATTDPAYRVQGHVNLWPQ